MNLSISLQDFYSIATYGRRVGSANLTEYPALIEAIQRLDPDELEFVVREVYGHQELSYMKK